MSKSILSLFLSLFLIFFLHEVNAEVWIPEDEFVGFYDSDGIYTVIGVIKNSEDFPVIPTISIKINDEKTQIMKNFNYINIMPAKELPFKFQIPEIKSKNPILENPEINFIKGVYKHDSVEVIYDDSLIVHSDGHVSGKMINTGTTTIPNFQLFAVIHGVDHEILDVGKNFQSIPELKPGEVRDFEMYPNPSISSKVWYYSCFAVGDDSIVTLNVQRNDETFRIRYDSGILISYPEFDSDGKNLSITLIKGWPLQNYLNIEFEKFSENEKFEVFLNGEHIDSIQSVDEMENWHVAFNLEPQSSGTLTITGFDPEGKPNEGIPNWIRNNAEWWALGKIGNDDFVLGIKFMIQEKILIVLQTEKQVEATEIPSWVKNNAGWWANDLISDEDFIFGLQYLITSEIISV